MIVRCISSYRMVQKDQDTEYATTLDDVDSKLTIMRDRSPEGIQIEWSQDGNQYVTVGWDCRRSKGVAA